MRKFFRFAAAAMCLVVAAAGFGCTNRGGGGSDEGEDSDGVNYTSGTLTVWSCFNSTSGDQGSWAVAENLFHEKYPNITIRTADHKLNTDCYNDLAYYAAINKLPDIVNTEMYTSAMVNMGYLVPLDDYIDEGYKDSFLDGIWKGATFGDSVYAVPVRASVMSLLCNMTLLRKAAEYDQSLCGGKYTSGWFENDDFANGAFVNPTTPDEFLGMCKNYHALYTETHWQDTEQAANKDDLYGASTSGAAVMVNVVESGESSAFRALAYMAMFGGDFVDPDGNVKTNTEKNVEGMELWQDLVLSDCTYGYAGLTEDNINSFFMAESTSTPFMIDIPAIFANYDGGAKLTFDYEYYPLPLAEGVDQSVLCGSIYMGVTKSCSNKTAAAYFVKCLASAEYQREMYNTSTYRLPVLKSVIEEIIADESGAFSERNEEMLSLVKDIQNRKSFVFGLPGFSTSYSDIWAKWTTCINAVYNGGKVADNLQTFDDSVRGYLN